MKLHNIALAALLASSPFSLMAESNLYLGAELGSARINDRTQSIADNLVRSPIGGSATVTQTVRNGTFRIFGGYHVNENVDLELGYIQTRSFDLNISGRSAGNVAYAASGTVKVSGFDYSALLRPSKESGFNELFFRIGGHNFSSKASYSMSVGGNQVSIPSSKTSGSGMLYGLGYDLSIDKNTVARAGLTRYREISGIDDANATVISFGLKRSF